MLCISYFHAAYNIVIFQTDHSNRQVVVCLRGTMSLDDVATDCECEVTSIDTGDFWDACDPNGTFLVHGGMLRVALAVGRQSGPLTSALNHALTINPGYCEIYIVTSNVQMIC